MKNDKISQICQCNRCDQMLVNNFNKFERCTRTDDVNTIVLILAEKPNDWDIDGQERL